MRKVKVSTECKNLIHAATEKLNPYPSFVEVGLANYQLVTKTVRKGKKVGQEMHMVQPQSFLYGWVKQFGENTLVKGIEQFESNFKISQGLLENLLAKNKKNFKDKLNKKTVTHIKGNGAEPKDDISTNSEPGSSTI